jgi:hypothetical protein
MHLAGAISAGLHDTRTWCCTTSTCSSWSCSTLVYSTLVYSTLVCTTLSPDQRPPHPAHKRRSGPLGLGLDHRSGGGLSGGRPGP